MNRITVFNGPEAEFLKLIPNQHKTLSEVVRLVDSQTRELRVVTDPTDASHVKAERLSIEHLAVHSDEYTGVNEHVIVNFLNYLSLHDVDNLWLHNPPIQILNQIERSFSGEVETLSFEYKQLDKEMLKAIKAKFSESIIGQERVETEILSTLYPLTKQEFKRPIVMLFYGPSGVGKTETARFISTFLGRLFRLQLSMFQNDSFSAYLFGDNTNRNSFSKDLMNRESNIILLDEFDKANPIFHSAFYQMFDEGVFEDKNYKVNINSSLILCTSNYKTLNDVRERLGDAIFSRFDNMIEFTPLSPLAKEQIITLEFDKQLRSFTAHEQGLISRKITRERLLQFVDNFTNVRTIQKVIRQLMTLPLIEEL